MKTRSEWKSAIAECVLAQISRDTDTARIIKRCLRADGPKQRLGDLAYQAGKEIFSDDEMSTSHGASD